MADTNELKPCPCGKTPDRLGISDGSQGGKYHFVAGDCCSEWMIEFRANYKPIESNECMALAVAAWNASPRALVAIREATPQPADAAMADEDGNLALQLEMRAAALAKKGYCDGDALMMRHAAARLRALSQPAPQVYVDPVIAYHPNCNYVGELGKVCSKCGNAHSQRSLAIPPDGVSASQPAAPVAQVPEGFVRVAWQRISDAGTPLPIFITLRENLSAHCKYREVLAAAPSAKGGE